MECSLCHTDKPISRFYKTTGSKQCKKCQRQLNRERALSKKTKPLTELEYLQEKFIRAPFGEPQFY